eukprot:350397-Chlamydomonas_euryale.AAC.6
MSRATPVGPILVLGPATTHAYARAAAHKRRTFPSPGSSHRKPPGACVTSAGFCSRSSPLETFANTGMLPNLPRGTSCAAVKVASICPEVASACAEVAQRCQKGASVCPEAASACAE